MDNLELIIKSVKSSQLNDLFSLLDVKYENIDDAHFFENSKNISDISKIDFTTYYQKPGTGFIRLKKLNIGIEVVDAIIVISGVNDDLEVTINFPYYSHYNEGFETIKEWVSQHLQFAKIIFGFEPADDSEQIIFLV